jgi:hypothetical protein
LFQAAHHARFAPRAQGLQERLHPRSGFGCALAVQPVGDRPEVIPGVMKAERLASPDSDNGVGKTPTAPPPDSPLSPALLAATAAAPGWCPTAPVPPSPATAAPAAGPAAGSVAAPAGECGPAPPVSLTDCAPQNPSGVHAHRPNPNADTTPEPDACDCPEGAAPPSSVSKPSPPVLRSGPESSISSSHLRCASHRAGSPAKSTDNRRMHWLPANGTFLSF